MSTVVSRSNPPSREEILGYFSELSNWGRWGDEDQLGTLNLITPELRRRAAALITEGMVVPLGMDLDPGPLARGTQVRLEPMHSAGNDDHYGGVGYHASALPLLHERGVAVIASDALNDMNPSGYAFDGPATPAAFDRLDVETASLTFPVHAIALTAMGAWLLDHVEVEELALTCRRLGRWEFFLSVEPLRMVGSTGSHVNPLAIF